MDFPVSPDEPQPPQVGTPATLSPGEIPPAIEKPEAEARLRALAGRASPVAGTLWRWRVAAAGLASIALALLAEWLMRGPGPSAPPPNAGLPTLSPTSPPRPGPITGEGQQRAVPVRAARASLAGPSGSRLVRFARLYREARANAGWQGTALGLTMSLLLGLFGVAMEALDQANTYVPWIWIASALVLILTFAGARPYGESLVAHDPHEPPAEPPVSRREWALVAGILIAAAALRLWNLEGLPAGPYIDEADRALVGRAIVHGLPVLNNPYGFFTTDWWGVPTAYFWLVGQSLRIFGDSLAGARAIHALAGVLTVWFAYRLGRVAWSPRAGLAAAALLTVSDFALQFSRTAGESTITMLTWAACIYFLVKALKSARPIDFVWSGIWGGLTLYGYASGKLLPFALVAAGAYVLVRWGAAGARLYGRGLALTALTMALVFAPHAVYLLKHPDELTMRSQGVSITRPEVAAQMRAAYGTESMAVVVWKQFELTFSAFDVGRERGPFYPTNQPVLPVPWAALWLLGVAYAVWRLGDARYGMLLIWLVGGLSGAALTNETPALQRTAAMVPLLALLPALYVDRVASGFEPAARAFRARVSRARVFVRPLASAAIALFVLVAASQTLPFYFGPYASRALYSEFTLAGRYAERLNPAADVLYQSGVPAFLGSNAPTRFLAGDVPLRELVNPSDQLPFVEPEGKNVHVLFFPVDDPLIRALGSLYPAGRVTPIADRSGAPFLSAFQVSAEALAATRQLTAHYWRDEGPVFERPEPRLGTLKNAPDVPALTPPEWMTYPMHAQWSGGLVAPAYGIYTLTLHAPQGASLDLDGTAVLSTTVGQRKPSLAEWVLAKGVHEVKLTGDLADPATAVELKWSAGRGVPVAVSPRFLWGGPPGALRGSVYAYGEAPGLMTAPTIDLSTLAPQERLDSVVSWMTIVGATGAPVNLFAMWRGTLTAPTPGQYAFDVDSDGQVSLFIDGRLVGVRGDQGNQPGIPAEVQLEAGDHTIELRFHGLRDPGRLALYWQAPGGLRELIPPSAFRGPRSGVWPPTERPSAPLPDPTLVDSEPSTSPATVATTINGGRGWKEARGVAVLPGGKVVVADTGNKRALVYSPEGTLVSTLGDPGDGASGFDLLADVAVGKDGLIAALDAGSGDVTLWDASGTLQNRLTPDRTGLARSSGIAFGPDGSIYVADTGNSRVVRLSRSGQQLLSYYEANGDFEALEQPTDVAITPGGDVFAVDLRHRVVRFDANGRIVAQYPLREGTERGGSHLAFWGDELAITVPEAGTVELLDLKTEAVRRVRLAGENAPTLVLPVGIATRPGDGTSPGPLYVLDSDSGRVYVLEHAAAGP